MKLPWSDVVHLGVFIYARADSRRLPGKALLPFAQSTLLEHVFRRAQEVQASSYSLLTSDRAIDDDLGAVARDAGLNVVRGSASDLVQRTITAIDTIGVDRFVRINADCPLFEPRLVNAALQRSQQDLVSNVVERRFPYGVAVEIVDTGYYLRLADAARPDELEHVTKHLYRRPRTGTILSLTQVEDHSCLRLAVDTPADYERIRLLCQPPASPLAPYWELLGLPDPALRWKAAYRL